MAVFQYDLNAAMSFKGQFPETTLIVSLEQDYVNHDAFWSHPEIVSVISIQTIVLRLTEAKTPDSFRQFQIVFQIQATPCLVVFGRNSATISKQWDEYPSPEEFLAFLQPNRTRTSCPRVPRPSLRKTVKISLQGSSGSVNKEFDRLATLGDLKDWLKTEIGPDYEVIVAHTQRSLPDDNSMTLVEADLAPTSILRVLSGDVLHPETVSIRPTEPIPTSPRVQQTPTCQCCNGRFFSQIKKYGGIAFSLLNPWAEDDPDEPFLEYKPNPERLRQIRRSVRMMRRMQQYQQQHQQTNTQAP